MFVLFLWCVFFSFSFGKKPTIFSLYTTNTTRIDSTGVIKVKNKFWINSDEEKGRFKEESLSQARFEVEVFHLLKDSDSIHTVISEGKSQPNCFIGKDDFMNLDISSYIGSIATTYIGTISCPTTKNSVVQCDYWNTISNGKYYAVEENGIPVMISRYDDSPKIIFHTFYFGHGSFDETEVFKLPSFC